MMTEISDQQTPGQLLREAREAANLTLDVVAKRLMVSESFINEVEQNDFDTEFERETIEQYLRAYAQLLRLPVDEVIACFHRYTERVQENETISGIIAVRSPSEVTSTSKRPKTPRAIVYVSLLAMIGITIWHINYKQKGQVSPKDIANKVVIKEEAKKERVAAKVEAKEDKVPSKAEVKEENVVAKAEPKKEVVPMIAAVKKIDKATWENMKPLRVVKESPLVIKANEIELIFDQDSWVEITDATKKRLLYGLIKKGRVIKISGKEPYHVLLGNAHGVKIIRHGKQVVETSHIAPDHIARLVIGNSVS